MKSRSDNRPSLQQARKSWLALSQIAVWISGILGGFLLAPPVGVSAADQKTWLRLGQFVIAVIVGLELLAARRWSQPRHSIRWGGLALLALAIGVAAFFRYQQLSLAWTANYAGAKVVLGSEFTEQGRAYSRANPNLSADALVFDFAGRTEDIWTRQSIDRHRLVLAATYISCLPLFTICLIAVVQALQSSELMAGRRTRQTASKQGPKT